MRDHHIHVLTSYHRITDDNEDEPGITRALHIAWGPPYPPEDLPNMLRCESEDRRLLAAAIRNLRPDVVDVWGMEFASQSLIEALLRSGVPVHLTLEDKWFLDGHMRDSLCMMTRMATELGVEITQDIQSVCNLSSSRRTPNNESISFVSKALSKHYTDSGFYCGHDRVRIAGINMHPFQNPTLPPEPPPFIIISTGQLTASRGQADLIEAAARVSRNRANRWPIAVRIIGGGNPAYITTLQRLAREHASGRLSVELIGPLPAARVAEFYAGAHLFAHTSHLPEGLPRVLMEAMAAGLPVIATHTGGQCDILDDGRWGTLLPPGNPKQLALAIEDVMNHLPDRQSRARKARQHALHYFDIDHYIDNHVSDLAKATHAYGPLLCNAESFDSLDRKLPNKARMAAFANTLGNAAEYRSKSFPVADNPDGAWSIGVTLKRTGRLAASEHLFARLYDTHPNDPVHIRRATFHLAELAMFNKEWSRAENLLEQCLCVAPDHAKAAFDLAQSRNRHLPVHLKGLSNSGNQIKPRSRSI
ncbi:MAG: glycosyltransferase [Phycisphaerae bacterium]